MDKKIWWVIGVVVVIIILVSISSKNKSDNNIFTVGAILPMTGPASLWGETFKNGMELALANTTGIKVLYEDSKSTAQDGISAFNKLQMQKIDLSVSELSLVAVPLAKVALEQKAPLLVSLVATNSSNIVSDYTTRYYTNPTNYATPAFTSEISPVLSAKKIALLHRNDELGIAVMNEIKKLSDQNGKTIVSLESFKPNETDYSTMLLKVKNSGADAFIFVVANPVEALGILKMANQLKLSIPIIESSAVFADLDTRAQAPKMTFYLTSYAFSLPGHADNFKADYKAKYGKEPNFGAAFGYDIVNLINLCKDKKESVRECLNSVESIDGVAGTASQVAPGDFVVPMHLEKVN